MRKLTVSMPKLHSSTIPALLLMMDWLAGLSLGFLAARFHGGTLAALILQSAAVRGSPLGTLFATMFPLFLSACAVFLLDSRWIYFLCLLRGLGLGVMLGAVCAACPGGLLLGALLLFSALLYSPVLFWYWLWRLWGCSGGMRDTLIALALGLGICAVDQWAIAPFLAYVMTI